MKKVFKYILFGFLALIVLGAILSVVSENVNNVANTTNSSVNNSTSSTTNEETSTKEDSKQDENKLVGIGEELQVGDVIFKVNKVSTTKRIEDGIIYYEPDTEGSVFFLINVSVKNVGNKMINTDASFFQLVKGDVTYSPTTLFTADDQFFIFEGINPGLTKTGNVVFEIPEGEQDFILQVQTGFWGTERGQIRLY